MVELFIDFMLNEHLPDGRERVRLPIKAIIAAGLAEGAEILLVEEDNLRAQVLLQYDNGHWYGVIIGTVEDISPAQSQACAS